MSGGLTRREFLKIAGIATLLAGVTGVSYKTLEHAEKLVLAGEGEETDITYKPSRCGMCPQGCAIMVRVNNGRVERIFGNPYGFDFNRATICARGNMGVYRLYNPDRLRYPLIRSSGSERGEWAFQQTDWATAYDQVRRILEEKISNNEQRKVIWMAGWASCDMYKVPLVAFLKTFGFPNASNQPMGTCFMPKAMGWSTVIGVGAHPQIMTDYDKVKYLIVLRRNHGGSISVAHSSRIGQNLRNFKLVVLDPRLSEEAARADEWVPIRPGTDLAFLLAMMYVILKEKLYDEEYLREYTNAPMLVDAETLEPLELKDMDNGKKDFKVWDLAANAPAWSREAVKPALEGEYEIGGRTYIPVLEALKRHLEKKGYTPEWASKITDVPAETIERIAREFGMTRPAAIDTGWHGAKTYNSFQTWRAVALLNALVGSPLREGGILLSHGGIKTTLHPSSLAAPPESDLSKGLAELTFTLSSGAKMKGVVFNVGRTYLPLKKLLLEGSEDGWVLFVVGANPVRTMLDGGEDWVHQAFKSEKVDKIIVYDVMPQDTSLYADIVLPDCMYLERYDCIRGVEFVPITAFYTGVPAVKPLADCFSFMNFLALLAKDLGKGEEWAKMFGTMLGLSDEYKEKLADVVENEVDRSMLTDREKREHFVMRLQEIQAEYIASKIGKDPREVLKTLRTKGFLTVAGKEKIVEENREILESGILNTPTGKVEIFSLALWVKGVKAKGIGIQPEIHPLIDWVPPRALMEKPELADNEFYLIYGKAPSMTHTHTADNPILSVKLTPDIFKRIWINPARARKLGIKDGDLVEVCNANGKCYRTRVYVTELVRPDTAFYVNAWGHENPVLRFTPKNTIPWNQLVRPEVEPVTGSIILGDTYVTIRKVSE